MSSRNICGLCKKIAPVTSIPGPASVNLIKLYKKDYKGSPLCRSCHDMAKKRVAGQQRHNQENESPNKSSSSRSSVSLETPSLSTSRPNTEPASAASSTERGDSLNAQRGTQTISQPIGTQGSSQGNEVPPFLPEIPAQLVSIITQEVVSQEPLLTQSSDTPAQLDVYTPEPEVVIPYQEAMETHQSSSEGPERDDEPLSKRRRVVLSEIEEEETIEEREEDAPPEVIIEQIPDVSPTAAEDVQEVIVITNVSTTAPLPRNPRIRDEDLRAIMERSQDVGSRGEQLVNNMPRTHAG